MRQPQLGVHGRYCGGARARWDSLGKGCYPHACRQASNLAPGPAQPDADRRPRTPLPSARVRDGCRRAAASDVRPPGPAPAPHRGRRRRGADPDAGHGPARHRPPRSDPRSPRWPRRRASTRRCSRRVISELAADGLLERDLRRARPPCAWVRATPAGRRLAERMRRERTEAVDRRAGRAGAPPSGGRRRRAARAGGARRASSGPPRMSRIGARPLPPFGASRTTFAALAVPNYRRYYGGQAISLIGTWMQMTAQSWLVLTLTHSGTALGVGDRPADAAGAAAGAVRRRDRRPGGQATADDRAAVGDGASRRWSSGC